MNRPLHRQPSCLAPVLLLALSATTGCPYTGNNGKNNGDSAVNPLRIETQSVVSDSGGVITLSLDVQDGERFQVVQDDGKGGVVFTDSLTDPSGTKVLDWQDWQTSKYSYTEAVYGAKYANTTNWPIREEDGPTRGGTWTFVGDTLKSNYSQKPNEPVDITIAYRKDADPTHGAVHVIVAYCTGVDSDPEVVRGVEAAVATWTQIWAAFGITLTVDYAEIALDPALPNTSDGEQAYQDLAAQYDDHPLIEVIGDSIAGDLTILGETSAIPGPMAATQITAVEVSWMGHAGGNGNFSDGEIQMMGETMAHETGHFLGMFHPVEDGWQYWDYLDDTEDCTNQNTCEADLGSNLMFPYTICTTFTSCDPQQDLSPKQVGIMLNYVGVE